MRVVFELVYSSSPTRHSAQIFEYDLTELTGQAGRTYVLFQLWKAFENSVQPKAFLMYVVNLEMNNSPKRVLLNIVSGQIASDTPWKYGKAFLFRI